MPETASSCRRLKEGLRLDRLSGIVSRNGPLGGGPGWSRGPDAFEVVEAVRAEAQRARKDLGETRPAPWPAQVAADLHAFHPAQIKEAIELNPKLMEQAALKGRR